MLTEFPHKGGHIQTQKRAERHQKKHLLLHPCGLDPLPLTITTWFSAMAFLAGAVEAPPFFWGAPPIRSGPLRATSRRMDLRWEEANGNWKQPSELDAENSSEARISCTACGYRIIQRFLLVKSATQQVKNLKYSLHFLRTFPNLSESFHSCDCFPSD